MFWSMCLFCAPDAFSQSCDDLVQPHPKDEMAEFSDIIYSLEIHSFRERIKVPVDEINKKFGLSARESLIFVNPSKDGYLGFSNVNSYIYHKGLSNGIVYVSRRHDLTDHMRGFFRLAKTKPWRDTKALLRELFKITETPYMPRQDIRAAQGYISLIADLIERATTELSHGYRRGSAFHPGYPIDYNNRVNQFRLDIEEVLKKTLDLRTRGYDFI